jgi:hypothetical protein
MSDKTQGDQVSADQFFDDRTVRAKALFDSLDETDQAYLHEKFMVPAVEAGDEVTWQQWMSRFTDELTTLVANQRKVSRYEIRAELEEQGA